MCFSNARWQKFADWTKFQIIDWVQRATYFSCLICALFCFSMLSVFVLLWTGFILCSSFIFLTSSSSSYQDIQRKYTAYSVITYNYKCHLLFSSWWMLFPLLHCSSAAQDSHWIMWCSMLSKALAITVPLPRIVLFFFPLLNKSKLGLDSIIMYKVYSLLYIVWKLWICFGKMSRICWI